MRLTPVFAGSIAKDDHPACVNEDSFALDAAAQRFCVSDGAGQSYAPALWSNIITRTWLQSRSSVIGKRQHLSEAVTTFNIQCAPDSLSWSKLAAFNRGTFATLLGVRLKGHRFRATAIGDSLLVIAWPDGRVVTFPYDDSDAFNADPELISTRDDANSVFSLTSLRARSHCWVLSPGSRVFLMTDALGRWLLGRHADDFARGVLSTFRTVEDFALFVRQRRDDGSLQVDDTTLVHLYTDDT